MKWIMVCAMTACCLLNGCTSASRYLVEVDSISAPATAADTNYILLSGADDVKQDDLQYREYATYVDRALSSKGFRKVDDSKDADIALFLSYGIGDPQTRQYTYSIPIYGQTGIASASTYGTLNSFGHTATYSGTTTYTPTYGIVGATTHQGSVTTYFRYLSLEAIDLKESRESRKIKDVWKTNATSTGTSDDLRQIFPIMVAATQPYLGSNTGRKVSVKLSDKSQIVRAIKGMPMKQRRHKAETISP